MLHILLNHKHPVNAKRAKIMLFEGHINSGSNYS